MDIAYATKFLGALFAIMNPFITLPLFLALTAQKSVAEQRNLAVAILGYTAVMCIVIALAGSHIISFFGVSLDSFRVAGGMVLIGIALSMLNGQPITSHERATQEKSANTAAAAAEGTDDNPAFYPLTFPMIIGPGTIATLIIYSAQARDSARLVSFGVVLLAVLAALFAVLYFAASIGRLLSTKMRVIMARVMGIILAAIAVEMVFAGAKAMLPGLAH
ncbi:MarC family protein [uncultured Castellaniella sp.]|jgi:multiple antibiotic resistance protein|uniref:MarC family protein n=1 Tax=uncultured Castellaniella sp. TaxID=647907 RepID=UPI002632F713|nr:MarC family protein [uncultured Castellaniella sp.]